MEANPRTLLKVFQPDIQYVVPIFQRRYVWNEEDQWAELWEDLLEILDDVEQAEQLNDAGAEIPLPSHFLGAIVCDQSISSGSDIDERPLIDGQQRLTTFQVVLAETLKLSREHDAEQACGLIERLVENDGVLVNDPHEAFKVWPSEPDRLAFIGVMNGELVDGQQQSLITLAGDFFREKITDWIGDEDPAEHLRRLARTLRTHVELVVIDLQPGDNAQVIFESLNYGGRDLTAIDLTKNHVFFQAGKQGLSVAEIREMHQQQWSRFDNEWWRTEATQGRLRRSRAELFLSHWLKLERLEEVRSHRLFVDFRDLPALKDDLVATVERLAADRDLYYICEEQPGDLLAPTGGFFPRLETLNQSTPRPVTLQLLRAVPDRLLPERAARAIHALDSYLWRRALMRGSTANYNRIMLDALKAIAEGGIDQADDHLIEYLAGLEGWTVEWPRDDEFRADLEIRQLYGQGRVKLGVIRTALRAVENRWRAPMGEDPLGPTAELQIEHILPQAWEEHWPLDPEPEATLIERQQNRNAHLHRLGNLTLVSPSMNQSISHREWLVKRPQLAEHSNALITRRYLDLPAWNEHSIQSRTSELFATLCEIWPDPTGVLTVADPN